MSTHSICFRREIRKIFTGYPPLSRPMNHISMEIPKKVKAKYEKKYMCVCLG